MLDNCPRVDELLVYALRESPPIDGERLEDHLSSCQMCQTDVTAIREAAADLRMNERETPLTADACLDDVAIAELVEGLVNEERSTRLEHVASCTRCLANVAGVARLLSDQRIQSEIAKIPPPTIERERHRFAMGTPLGLAAAAALLLTLAIPSDTRVPPEQPVHRNAVLTETAAPRTIVPTGETGHPVSLVWASVPLADLYEVTLFSAEGSVMWMEQTTDSVAFVPGSIVLQTGETYFWKVRARTGWDRWSESKLTEFTVVPPANVRQ